ncbi:MAG: hypothetical protein M3Q07_05195 [Pseudobdellovibrionaceae bacterium]|nr:hypothetical protein [Pseudobdellovibrionaceae bacterium]
MNLPNRIESLSEPENRGDYNRRICSDPKQQPGKALAVSKYFQELA